MKRLLISSWIILILGVILSGCSETSSRSEKNVFRYNESNGISSLDPAFARDLENMWAVNQLFDGLVELDSSLNIAPLIARSWEISEDGKTYTFHLREDVRFHESPLFEVPSERYVTAYDVFFSFNRIVEQRIASPGQWVFAEVDFTDGKGFEVVDNQTFRIRLVRAFPPFLGMLSMQYCNVVPKEVVEHYGEDFRSNPIGTGPFKFAFWMENVALVYHKNPYFWQKDEDGVALPYLDAVKIDFVRDMSAEFMGLVKGQYDFMSGIHPAYKDELLDPYGNLNFGFEEQIYFQHKPFIKTDYIGILVDGDLEMVQNSALSDKRVRQALNFAVDRSRMVRFLRNNAVYAAGHGFIPKGLKGYEENSSFGFDFNLEKAAELLVESGFPGGKGIEQIELATTSDYVDLCEFLQHAWAQIGIDVQVEVMPSAVQREKVSRSQVMLFRKSWLADYPDAENFLGLFKSSNFCPQGPNYTHFKSELFDSYYNEAIHAVNDSLRWKLYTQMDSLIMNESPIIPLFYDQVSHFIRNEVVDFETNPLNMLELKRTSKVAN
jgi:ABC-type transport system substrate-binding protein